MGTSTIFRRYNDFGGRLATMSKEELAKIDAMSAWKSEKDRVQGWEVLMELHNGNVHPLIWWNGQLFHLRDGPGFLLRRHYNRYTGKYSNISDWTLLKKYLERELKELDKAYRRLKARQYSAKKRT